MADSDYFFGVVFSHMISCVRSGIKLCYFLRIFQLILETSVVNTSGRRSGLRSSIHTFLYLTVKVLQRPTGTFFFRISMLQLSA